MTQNDPLASVLSSIQNYEALGKSLLRTPHSSRIIKQVLDIMASHGYVGSYEVAADSKGASLTINLLGTINKTGVIKPRFAVKTGQFEKWERRFLPAKSFGLLIVSTTKGFMTAADAKKQGLGGRLISYCY